MKKIIPIDIIKGFSDKFCGSNSKENFATNKCSSAYFPYRSPFVLRSSSVQAPFNLRSSSVQAPFKLRSGSVRAPFNLRSGIGERTKNKGKCNDNISVLKRRDSEAQKGTNNTEI